MNIKHSEQRGFTMIELLVVLAIIGLIAAIAVPNLFRARNTAQQRACIENLTRIEGVKQQWGAESKKSENDVPDVSDLTPYLKQMVTCPSGGTYTFNALGVRCTCTIPGHTL